ncbi:MAG: hypothetical protein NXI16_01265 [Alphaproteobacteria bacterium]|nr:hypothetical protein [Alphaproteobacteria bacterium]
MTRHTLSRADELFAGDAVYQRFNSGKAGLPVTHLYNYRPGAIAADDADGVCAAQAVAGAGNLTIAGALASSGVATMDVARTLTAVSAGAGDTTQTLTITGTDMRGATIVETIALNGTSAVAGLKAFKTVTQVAASAATAGNVSVGTTDVIGLPFKLIGLDYLVGVRKDGLAAVPDAVTAGLAAASAETATSADVLGTISLATAAPDGSAVFSIQMEVNHTTKELAHGQARYAG